MPVLPPWHDTAAPWVPKPAFKPWSERKAAFPVASRIASSFSEGIGGEKRGDGRKADYGSIGGLQRESLPVPTPTMQQISHAKLDLLLHEVHRLDARLEAIAGRLERDTTRGVGEVKAEL